jgi:hypothetical protein
MRCDVENVSADAKPGAASEPAIENETAAADAGAGDTKVTVEDEDLSADRDDETSDAEEGGAGDKPRRSRSRRYKDRIARLERELAEARRTAHVPEKWPPVFRQGDAPNENDEDLVAPNERDYAHDYLAYDRALREYQTRKAVRDETRRQAERQAAQHRHIEQRERIDAYRRRLDDVRDRIPDFEQVMRAQSGAAIRDDVRDLVMDSPKGPLLAYYLATNPDVLDDINGMPPAAAAKTIGSLEARIRGPRPKLQTDARPSRDMPKGGASAGGKSYAEMSMDEFIAARQREQKAR